MSSAMREQGLPPDEPFIAPEPVSFRRRVRRGLEAALYWSGARAAFRRLVGAGDAVILMYHSVAFDGSARFVDPRNRIPLELFEKQMRFLARQRRVISTARLVELLRGKQPIPAGSVVLTFDDGYRDNLALAAVVLAELGLPATLYLPTGLVERGESPWADRLYTMFRTRTRQRLDNPLDGEPPYELLQPEQCRAGFEAVSQCLLDGTLEARVALLARVEAQLEPREQTPRLTMNWNEVRSLAERFPDFELGAHSTNHVDLTRQAPEVVRRELDQCVSDFERELGHRPQHFAYPYNRADRHVREAVSRCGFLSAVSAGRNPLIRSTTDPLLLPRLELLHSMTRFRAITR